MLLLFENCQMYLPLEFRSRLSFLTENSNTIIITAFAQNCVGLNSDPSFCVTVCLRQCHSLVETGKMPSKCIFHYISFILLFNS